MRSNLDNNGGMSFALNKNITEATNKSTMSRACQPSSHFISRKMRSIYSVA